MDVEQILRNLVRIGTVTDVNIVKHQVRVKFEDSGITSGWLCVLQHHKANLYIEPDAEHTHDISDTYSGGGNASTYPNHDHLPGSYLTYWMPKVNEQVLTLYLPVFNGDGFVLGGIT